MLHCRDLLDDRFLNYLTYTVYFQQTCFHSSIGVHIEKMIFKVDDWFRWKIDVPSLADQRKIAGFLSAVDEKLDILRRQRDLLQSFRRGMMQKIFSQELRFKATDGSNFPKWKKKRLSELAQMVTTKNIDMGITRVLTNSATRGVVDQLDYFDKDIANADNLGGYYVVEAGDYVYNPRISVSAPVGPINKNKIGKGVTSPLYNVFRFNATTCSSS